MAGTADARARARELATEALSAAATPAGRTTSLPVNPRVSAQAAHEGRLGRSEREPGSGPATAATVSASAPAAAPAAR